MNTSFVHYTEVGKFGKYENFIFDVISTQSKDILAFNGKKVVFPASCKNGDHADINIIHQTLV